MITMTLREIADAIDGKLIAPDESALVSGLAQTDSREVTCGDVFFARVGETQDGHSYADSAVNNGAVLLVCQRQLEIETPQIIVPDTTAALGELAAYNLRRRRQLGDFTVVAITGSNGKTTTKNLTAKMLDMLGVTVAADKSFNNEVGAPITMLRANEDTRYLVLEIGASAPGEIANLTSYAKPDIGVVLMVGLAHAGGFGGLDVTQKSKAEMVQSLSETGLAILNIDDPRVRQMTDNTAAKVTYFGLSDEANVRARNIESGRFGTRFELCVGDRSVKIAFPVLGEHHVYNALAAASVALHLGLSLENVKNILEQIVRPAKWRMEVHEVPGDITIINDAYNASPDSMSAALKTLAQVKHPTGRTIAVLGAMSELGDIDGEAHDRIGLQAVRLRISQTIVVGESIRRMYVTAVNEGAWDDTEAHYFATHDEALEYLKNELRPYDTVLIKSSNAAGLRHLGDRLVEEIS